MVNVLKLPVDGFKWKKNNFKFDTKIYKKEWNKLVWNKQNKLDRLVCNLCDKNYIVNIRALKQALNHKLILKIE